MKNTIIALAFFAITLIISGCSLNNTDNYYIEDNGVKTEIFNPYSEGSGHYAGYEWAEKTGGSCSGNSTSFIEGCEEYYRQIED